MENYLQRAWSDAEDNIGIAEVKQVILELKAMDDEHGAFWVGVVGVGEVILETDKNKNMILAFSERPEDNLNGKEDSWEEVILNYQLLLNGEFNELRNKLTK